MEPNKQKFNFSLDYRIISILLFLTVIAMLALWRPWSATSKSNEQVIEVTGEAKLTDVPDEYVFSPTYQFRSSNKDVALAELTEKSNQVIDGLKKLEVPENKIKTNANGYDYPIFREERTGNQVTYNLQITVTINNKELAQKVQDYLLTTSPSGGVSPQVNFSEQKQKELEEAARNEATKDAKAKADQMAANLGFKVGKVKSVSDKQGFGVFPVEGRTMTAEDSISVKPQLNLQPGENDLHYSVTVTYFIR